MADEQVDPKAAPEVADAPQENVPAPVQEDAPEPVQARTAVPVTVDNRTRRSDDDAIEGSFVDVVAGKHAGRFGSFRQAVAHDLTSGYPTRILVRTRDELNELLEVAYEHVRPSKRTGGR